MSKPLFSIMTPVYNGARFLHRCYYTLCAQTLADWEWILVDDGSTDGSADVMRDIAAADSRVKFTSYPRNRGRGHARTLALNNSSGEWSVVWDADDMYFPNRLERIAAARRDGADFYTSRSVVVDSALTFLGIRELDTPFAPLSVRTGCHAAMAMRLDLAKQIGYFPNLTTVGQIGEDVAILYVLALKYRGFLDEAPMLINMIGNEVFLRKSLDANRICIGFIRELYDRGDLPMPAADLERMESAARRKIRILRTLRFAPGLYPMVMKFRRRGQMAVVGKLTPSEEAFLDELRRKFVSGNHAPAAKSSAPAERSRAAAPVISREPQMRSSDAASGKVSTSL